MRFPCICESSAIHAYQSHKGISTERLRKSSRLSYDTCYINKLNSVISNSALNSAKTRSSSSDLILRGIGNFDWTALSSFACCGSTYPACGGGVTRGDCEDDDVFWMSDGADCAVQKSWIFQICW